MKRRRDKETKRQREEETKRQRDKETKRQREEEAKRGRDKKTKRRRDEEPFLCATAGRDLCTLTAQPCCGKIECAFGAAASV